MQAHDGRLKNPEVGRTCIVAAMHRPLSGHIPGTDKLQITHVKTRCLARSIDSWHLIEPSDNLLNVRLEIPVKADLKHCFREEHVN